MERRLPACRRLKNANNVCLHSNLPTIKVRYTALQVGSLRSNRKVPLSRTYVILERCLLEN